VPTGPCFRKSSLSKLPNFYNFNQINLLFITIISEQMDVGIVKVAEDQDFEKLKKLVDDHTGWKLDYNKSPTKVWTKSVPNTNFKMIKVQEYHIYVLYI